MYFQLGTVWAPPNSRRPNSVTDFDFALYYPLWVVCFSFYAVIICVFDVILFLGILSRYFKASNFCFGPRTTLRAFRAGYACSGNSQLMPNAPYWQFLDYTLISRMLAADIFIDVSRETIQTWTDHQTCGFRSNPDMDRPPNMWV